MLITRDLDKEFRQANNQAEGLSQLRSAAREAGPYSYLSPDLVREPRTVQGPMPVRVGHGIANIGSNSRDSSYLTGVEKRAIAKSASSIVYTDPEIKIRSPYTVMYNEKLCEFGERPYKG